MHIIPKEKSRTCGNVCKYWHYPNCQLLDPKMERYIDSLWNQPQVGMGSKTAEEIRAIGCRGWQALQGAQTLGAVRQRDPSAAPSVAHPPIPIRYPGPTRDPYGSNLSWEINVDGNPATQKSSEVLPRIFENLDRWFQFRTFCPRNNLKLWAKESRGQSHRNAQGQEGAKLIGCSPRPRKR